MTRPDGCAPAIIGLGRGAALCYRRDANAQEFAVKALGLLSLLLALVLVLVLSRMQLGRTHALAPGSAAVAASSAGLSLPRVDNAEDARRVPQRVQNDVSRMMQDSASQLERATDNAEKP